MSAVAFSGLASGLDTATLVSQLVEIKRQPIYRMESRKKGYQDEISSLGTLKTKLLALQEAAQKLDSTSEFNVFGATSSDEESLTVSAGSGASPGSYDIVINNLAVAQKDVSQGFDSLGTSVGEGILSFTVDGQTTDLNLSGYTSLESLAELVNNEVDGVSATIINDGSGTDAYRLVLSGSEAGTANAFSVDASGLSGGTTPVFTNTQAATDASLTIDGMAVTASSNHVTDAISGLTLDLLDYDAADPQTIRVDVTADNEAIAENVKSFVDAYNDLFSFISEQSGAEGTLRSNPTLRSVATRMENIFTSSLDGGQGDFSLFAQVGISRGEGRQLVWNEQEFLDTLDEDFSSVRDLFVYRDGNVGKSYLIDTAIDDMTDSVDGLFKISTDALNQKIDYADQNIDRYERSAESYRERLERKFTAMEMMVSQLQAQGNYLSSVGF